MEDTFQLQMFFQLFLLISNCTVVALNFGIIIFRVVKVFLHDKYFGHRVVYFEVYISFLIDFGTAIVAGCSYFILIKIYNSVDFVIGTSCLGNFEEHKLDNYANDLYDTADQNLQIFVVMLLKIFLISFSMLYYIIVEEFNITCNKFMDLFYENIHEGDEEDAPMDAEEVEEDKKKLIGVFFHKSSAQDFKKDSIFYKKSNETKNDNIENKKNENPITNIENNYFDNDVIPDPNPNNSSSRPLSKNNKDEKEKTDKPKQSEVLNVGNSFMKNNFTDA